MSESRFAYNDDSGVSKTNGREIRTFMNCSRAMIFFMDPIVARRFNTDIPGITQTVQVDKGKRLSSSQNGSRSYYQAGLTLKLSI